MRIALVTSTFLPSIGGTEFVVHHLATQWSLQGHEVCVINWKTSEIPHADALYDVMKYPVLRGSTRFSYHKFPFEMYAVKGIKKCLKVFKPDFISAHFGYPIGYWLSKITPLPKYVVTCHGGDITHFDWGSRARMNSTRQLVQGLQRSQGVIAISQYCADMVKELGVTDEKILRIPNGADIERFQRKVNIDIRQKFGIPNNAKIVLSVGREHPQKDWGTGIKAFNELQKVVPNVYYLVLGKGVNVWEKLTQELNICDKVLLCDGLMDDELVAAYTQSNVLFSCSIWEMLSLVVLEALAAGLPQVVTNISGSPDVIKNGQNGFVVEPNDVPAMAKSLENILTNDDLSKQMRSNNLKKSLYYSWDNISKVYLEHMQP